MMDFKMMKTGELKAPLLAAMRSGDRKTVDAIKEVLVARAIQLDLDPYNIKPSRRALEEYKREVLDKK